MTFAKSDVQDNYNGCLKDTRVFQKYNKINKNVPPEKS